MKALTPTQSRTLAVALLVLLLVVLVRLVALPLWLAWSDYGERIGMLETRQAVYERLAKELPDDQKRLAQLRQNRPTSNWYLPETTPALAAATLQQRLHQQITRSGGQVISTQILNRKEDTPVPAVSVQVHMRGELSQLVDLLYSLEGGRPVLVLDNFVILASPPRVVRVVQGRNRIPVQQLPALDVHFDMTGFGHQEVQP